MSCNDAGLSATTLSRNDLVLVSASIAASHESIANNDVVLNVASASSGIAPVQITWLACVPVERSSRARIA